MMEASRLERRSHVVPAICMALALHAALWLLALRVDPSVELPARSEIEVSFEQLRVEPAEPAEPIAPQPRPTRAAAPKFRVAARSHKQLVNSPPPAQAAAVLAQEPDPSGPVDLTSEIFVTGTARALAGGVTSSTGAASAMGGSGEVGPGSSLPAADASSAVSLENQAWSCPWPVEADAERIDEQTVVIRVVVGAAGNAESATLVSDPGRGFGPAAISCALRTRFTPARDVAGHPVRAKSPPIRVRFTR
jgi:periplasmic protein TonB